MTAEQVEELISAVAVVDCGAACGYAAVAESATPADYAAIADAATAAGCGDPREPRDKGRDFYDWFETDYQKSIGACAC